MNKFFMIMCPMRNYSMRAVFEKRGHTFVLGIDDYDSSEGWTNVSTLEFIDERHRNDYWNGFKSGIELYDVNATFEEVENFDTFEDTLEEN